jgi:serine/threonine protein kinase
MSVRSFRLGPGGARPVHRLGKYTLTGVLGEGAMGIVYKALDPHINRTVAIKTVRRDAVEATSPDVSATVRFRNEAQAAGRLSHPHIVPIYEYGVDGHEAYIVMEFVDGQPLTRYIAGGRLWPIHDVLGAMVQLLDALHYAHQQGVLHRDIKPANIILDQAGRLKITDFGIARIDSIELTQKSSVVGSPGYMAPERYMGDTPGRGVDVFSCGVLLYVLLTGESPFPGAMDAAMYKILYTEPVPPSRVPSSPRPVPECYDAIVARALAKQPQDRYATALAFRDALLASATGPVPTLLSAASVQSWIDPADRDGKGGAPEPAAPDAAPPGPASPPAFSTTQGMHSTLPPTGWDTDALDKLHLLLAAHLGPIAKVVVRRTARDCHDMADLVMRLADETLAPADRKLFLAQAVRAFPHAQLPEPSVFPPSQHGPGSSQFGDADATRAVAATGGTPLTPAVVEQATRLLTRHIGPIATLLARQAAAGTRTREQFFALLAERAADTVDPQVLLEELANLKPGA